LLGDDAAESQECSIAAGLRKELPEVRQGDLRPRLQGARGGTSREGVRRMVNLRVGIVPGEAGTNRPASGAPVPRLWATPGRVDNREHQVHYVRMLWGAADISRVRNLPALSHPQAVASRRDAKKNREAGDLLVRPSGAPRTGGRSLTFAGRRDRSARRRCRTIEQKTRENRFCSSSSQDVFSPACHDLPMLDTSPGGDSSISRSPVQGPESTETAP
jgi:hypothetical protein